ncbi:MAG: hypothetical protein IT368_12925 [Candidatus Hydrogenedentes bacterium]|nr:hypothetical protein [Candidatus Hydrogenedentota bacterium]
MISLTLILSLPLLAAPEFAGFQAPGYAVPAAGVRYLPGEVRSEMPLGGLGTGFVGLNSDGSLGASVTENNWLDPLTLPDSNGFSIRAGSATVSLGSAAPLPEGATFWGHYPMADLDAGLLVPGLLVSMRAFSPLVPHEYDLSNTPAALFRYTVTNTSDAALPVEIALDWQAPAVASGLAAEGNVEAGLSWHREFLQPGEVWVVRPSLVFAASRGALEEALAKPVEAGDALQATDAVEGATYKHGAIDNFLVDQWGGFDWEDHGRQSAVYAGVPQVGQVLWQVRHGDVKAGRNREGGFGLSGTGLPAPMKDGTLEVALEVHPAGEQGVTLAYQITNTGEAAVEDVAFGIAVNFDLGGKDAYANNTAQVDEDRGLVIVEQPDGIAAALAGPADSWYAAQWPAAHEAVFNDTLRTAGQGQMSGSTNAVPGGIAWRGERGSYAVGAAGEGWAIDARKSGKDAIMTRAERTLAPQESAEVTFALAWHFPSWRSSDGQDLRHRYTLRYPDAGAVLSDVLGRAAEIEQKIVAWQAMIYGAVAPDNLKDAVINSLYVLPRNSWWLDDGRFFQSESFTGCPITETLVCRYNGTFPLALMWPECEKSTMAEFVRTQQGDGQIAFSFGSPLGTQTPNLEHQQPIVSTEFVLLAWRDFALWQDEAWLRGVYPAMRAAMRFAMTLDTDGDLVVNEAPGSDDGFPANQYYDVWPWYGTSAYTGSICLAAWKALEQAAYAAGDYRFAEEATVSFQKAADALEALLWTGEYYRLYNDPAGERKSDTSLTNALCGQWFAYATGLGPLFPEDHIESVVQTVLRLNDGATPFGAVNGVKPDGAIDMTYAAHSAALTIGEVWNFCAMAEFSGRTDEALRLFDEIYGNVALRQMAPWNIPWSYNPETGAIQWGIHYYSNPCVWTLFQAIAPAAYARLGVQQGQVQSLPVAIEHEEPGTER